ncbi:Trimethyllysine dioxygenase, partial [Penicillium diatomitis]
SFLFTVERLQELRIGGWKFVWLLCGSKVRLVELTCLFEVHIRPQSTSTQSGSEAPKVESAKNDFKDAKVQKAFRLAQSYGNTVVKTNRPEEGPFWQLENCQCPKCVHPDTKQRIVDTFSISPKVRPKSVRSVDAENVRVKWNDGHESTYSWNWLAAHRGNTKPAAKSAAADAIRLPRPFEVYEQRDGNPYPEVAYDAVMSEDKAVLEWLENIWKWGFSFVQGVPVDPQSTKALIERIAFIRHTHYGGFWDFTADLTYKDTAYTNEWLGAHTDNTYFSDPARLQLFHLLSHTDGKGGESLLVDGFAAAKKLAKTSPQSYKILSTSRHPWHASGNEDVCIQPSSTAPVFSVHDDTKAVYQIRWNNYDRAPKANWHINEQKEWYEAARVYNNILTDSSNEIWTQLQPGTALIFDNWRMLHGRSEFTGKRRMCGGYVNNDDFVSRFRLLKFGRQKVLDNLGNINQFKRPDSPYSIY